MARTALDIQRVISFTTFTQTGSIASCGRRAAPVRRPDRLRRRIGADGKGLNVAIKRKT